MFGWNVDLIFLGTQLEVKDPTAACWFLSAWRLARRRKRVVKSPKIQPRTVDLFSEIRRWWKKSGSPVEGKVVLSHYLQGSYILGGGGPVAGKNWVYFAFCPKLLFQARCWKCCHNSTTTTISFSATLVIPRRLSMTLSSRLHNHLVLAWFLPESWSFFPSRSPPC